MTPESESRLCHFSPLSKTSFLGEATLCSDSEAGSYFRLTDFVYHSTLSLRVIEKTKGRPWKHSGCPGMRPPPAAEEGGAPSFSMSLEWFCISLKWFSTIRRWFSISDKWQDGPIRPSTGPRILRMFYGRSVLTTRHVRDTRSRRGACARAEKLTNASS